MTTEQLLKNAIQDATELSVSLGERLLRGDSQITDLSEFVKTGKTNRRCNNWAIVDDRGRFLAISLKGIIVFLYSNDSAEEVKARLKSQNTPITGLAVKGPNKEQSITIIKNGDLEQTGGETLDVSDGPTISFQCLGRFCVNNPRTDNSNVLNTAAIKALQTGKILDFSFDETQVTTKAQRTVIKESKGRRSKLAQIKPPEAGFVLVKESDRSYHWHRSGSFLIRYNRMTILLGVDRETYFGCELKENAKSLAEAYISLIPQKLRNRNCPRQGEWFLEPVAKNKVPPITEAIAIGGISEEGYDGFNVAGEHVLTLPIDNADSAYHLITGYPVCITLQGIFAFNPIVQHSEEGHVELNMTDGWYIFHHNNAKRSFSEEGVD